MTQERVNQINNMLYNSKERFGVLYNACDEYVKCEFTRYNLMKEYSTLIYELDEINITRKTDECEAMDLANEYDYYADYKENELHEIIAKENKKEV